MFKKVGLVLVLVAVVMMTAGLVMAQEEKAVNVGNVICPVMNEMITDPGMNTVEYDGKVYDLCCPACKEEFLKDPAKYVAKVEAGLTVAEDEKEDKGSMMEEKMEGEAVQM